MNVERHTRWMKCSVGPRFTPARPIVRALLATVIFFSVALSPGRARADVISDAMTALSKLASDLKDKVDNGGFPGPARAALHRMYLNISMVLESLEGVPISVGPLPPDTLAFTDESDPANPRITLSDAGTPPLAAVAAAIGHEAIHVPSIKSGTPNSIDEEVASFEKWAEIWKALKQPGDRDPQSETVEQLHDRGGSALREVVRAAYPELPEKAR